MNLDEFEKQVEHELETFTWEQRVTFVWCCAIRVLPFLAVDGNFDFWEKSKRQNYLYAIFYALDIAAATVDAAARATARAAAIADAAARVARVADIMNFDLTPHLLSDLQAIQSEEPLKPLLGGMDTNGIVFNKLW